MIFIRYCNWHLRGSTATNYHAGREKVTFNAPRTATWQELMAFAASHAIQQIVSRTYPHPDPSDVVIVGIDPDGSHSDVQTREDARHTQRVTRAERES